MIKMAMQFLVLSCLVLQSPTTQDDFRRERRGENAAAKDALENRIPPGLRVEGWLNTDGDDLKLEDLEGKVVVINFWGSW